ncbi:YchO family inverse autotransporter domain-containing protein [Salmonella enterica subsp. enterica serovar Choleraesuis]|nr:YchO family inverse autotransporter domain-containing protein [Salmonella enterica subsp. enterica serovar Choleraesuis]
MSLTEIKFCAVSLILLAINFPALAATDFIQQAKNPFDSNGDQLPDLGLAPESDAGEKRLAEMAKSFGEASMVDNGLGASDQFRQFAFSHLRDYFTGRVTSEAEDLLSPLGNAALDLKVNNEGHFIGSSGSLLTPWHDTQRLLTYSELGFAVSDSGTVGNLGIGQRWNMPQGWLLGYNTFYDNMLGDSLDRMGVGAEAWGDYLRFSANYYQPLRSWRPENAPTEQRLARGYDVTARAWLPFYRYLSTSVSVEQYFGDRVDLFDNGTGYRDPVSLKLGLNYTPVPLVTLTAQHRQGENGLTQENLGMQINYRFGVPIEKQLSAAEVAKTSSLRGSRYDRPERNRVPVMEYRQRKTLSVYLATPPWDLTPGETVSLKLQVRSRVGVRHLVWQGDTHILSLTPPGDPQSTDGWSVIIPSWDSSPEAVNSWRISVTVEDNNGQKVTSNWITLKAVAPLDNWDPETDRLAPLSDGS